MSSHTERAAVVAAASLVAVLVLAFGYILFPVEVAALSFAIGVVRAAYKLFDVGEWVRGGSRNQVMDDRAIYPSDTSPSTGILPMPKLMDRLRAIFDLEPSGDGQEQTPTGPVPPTRPVAMSAADDRGRQSIRESVDPVEALTVAQGQELMGPCQSCDGYWTREIKRGQKPQTCPVCKRDGPPNA